MSAVVHTAENPAPLWLVERLAGLPAHGRDAMALWLLRALGRDARMVGVSPPVARPQSLTEGLWSLSEGMPGAVGAMAAAVGRGDLPEAVWQWVNADLDGPNGYNWRLEVAIDLIRAAEKQNEKWEPKIGDRVNDRSTNTLGTIIGIFPEQEKGWRTNELIEVSFENGHRGQRTRDQLSYQRDWV